jgi:hypothetical protein
MFWDGGIKMESNSKKINGMKNASDRNSDDLMGILRQIADLQNKNRIAKMSDEMKDRSNIPVKSWNS